MFSMVLIVYTHNYPQILWIINVCTLLAQNKKVIYFQLVTIKCWLMIQSD